MSVNAVSRKQTLLMGKWKNYKKLAGSQKIEN